MKKKVLLAIAGVVLLAAITAGSAIYGAKAAVTGAVENLSLSVVTGADDDKLTKAVYETGQIYGNVEGCRGRYDIALLTAKYAIKNGVPPSVLAAKIAVESTCNSLAVSNKGAIGLSQVMPNIWNSEYDFSQTNLFNPESSISVGSEILGNLIRKHGLRDGVRRYNGQGPDAEAYATRVLGLAGIQSTHKPSTPKEQPK